MKRVWLATLLTVGGAWGQSPTPVLTPVLSHAYFSHIVSGGGWKTSLTVFNRTAVASVVVVIFHRDDGLALALPLTITQMREEQVETSPSVTRTVLALSTLVIESEALTTDILSGWAEVVSVGPVSGSAIISLRGQDGRTEEAAVPLDASSLPGLVLAFDNSKGYTTGVALVNPTDSEVVMKATLRNEAGVTYYLPNAALATIVIPAKGHMAFEIADRFIGAVGQHGTMEIESSGAAGRVTGLGLRFSGTGSFTSVPIWHIAAALTYQP